MDPILAFVLGAALSIAGYFATRWWEGKGTREKIHDFVGLINLHKEIKSGSVSLDGLERLRQELSLRSRDKQKYENEFVQEIVQASRASEESSGGGKEYEPQTQAEINHYFHITWQR